MAPGYRKMLLTFTLRVYYAVEFDGAKHVLGLREDGLDTGTLTFGKE
jgi:hypothetical protein